MLGGGIAAGSRSSASCSRSRSARSACCSRGHATGRDRAQPARPIRPTGPHASGSRRSSRPSTGSRRIGSGRGHRRSGMDERQRPLATLEAAVAARRRTTSWTRLGRDPRCAARPRRRRVRSARRVTIAARPRRDRVVFAGDRRRRSVAVAEDLARPRHGRDARGPACPARPRSPLGLEPSPDGGATAARCRRAGSPASRTGAAARRAARGPPAPCSGRSRAWWRLVRSARSASSAIACRLARRPRGCRPASRVPRRPCAMRPRSAAAGSCCSPPAGPRSARA